MWLHLGGLKLCDSTSAMIVATTANANCVSSTLSSTLQALDYEEQKLVNLQVAVSNKAAYSFGSGSSTGSATQKAYRVNINVINEKEGPRFQPSVKVVTISEDHTTVSIKEVIANYAAIDSDTLQIATNVR